MKMAIIPRKPDFTLHQSHQARWNPCQNNPRGIDTIECIRPYTTLLSFNGM
jgi:hypothetical protein